MSSLTTKPAAGRRFLFLMSSARQEGNAELLARRAAENLAAEVEQEWLWLPELALPPFEDRRHQGDGTYPAPEGDAKLIVEATLAATDLVFVAPLYWYSLPATAKLYLDHWSDWMRVPGLDFKARMAGKMMWGISASGGGDVESAEALVLTLKYSAAYMHMHWGGFVIGRGSKPGDVLRDAIALEDAGKLFVD